MSKKSKDPDLEIPVFFTPSEDEYIRFFERHSKDGKPKKSPKGVAKFYSALQYPDSREEF